MPVDVRRLLTSETWMLGSGEARGAAMCLWLESWHQVPASSLPENDRVLAHLSQSMSWRKIKAHALRGWVRCADNRIYHPVVAEKALEAWLEKLVQRRSGGEGNAKRWGIPFDRTAIEDAIVIAREKLMMLNPRSRALEKRRLSVIAVRSTPESRDDIAPRSPLDSRPDIAMRSQPDSPSDSQRDSQPQSPPESLRDRKGQRQGQGSLRTPLPLATRNRPPIASRDRRSPRRQRTDATRAAWELVCFELDYVRSNAPSQTWADAQARIAKADQLAHIALERIGGYSQVGRSTQRSTYEASFRSTYEQLAKQIP